MIFKKWKPFWSYDIEKTEEWLSEMAHKGYHISAVNRLTRMFSFENKGQEKLSYHISYAKNEHILPTTLINSGWRECMREGNWCILKNNEQTINLFPSRDDLVKRNRLHSLIFTIISIYYGIQLFLPTFFIFIMLTSSTEAVEVKIEPSPFWILNILYFLQVVAVMILAITMTRKLRAFERKYYNLEVDQEVFIGKTFAKWRPNWMMSPDSTGKWLEEMSLKGSHLVKIQGPRFLFEKGIPKQIAYALDFQWRASPSYAEIHKIAGWKFIYTTAYSFFKNAIWAKEYNMNEEKPLLIYDIEERQAQKKKLLIAQGGIPTLIVILMGFLLWKIVGDSQIIFSTTYRYFLIIGFIGAIIMHTYSLIRLAHYALKTET